MLLVYNYSLLKLQLNILSTVFLLYMSRDSTLFFDKKWISKIDLKNFYLMDSTHIPWKPDFWIVKECDITIPRCVKMRLDLTNVHKCLANDLFCVSVLAPSFGNSYENLIQFCSFCFHGNCVMWVLKLHYWNYKLVWMN